MKQCVLSIKVTYIDLMKKSWNERSIHTIFHQGRKIHSSTDHGREYSKSMEERSWKSGEGGMQG